MLETLVDEAALNVTNVLQSLQHSPYAARVWTALAVASTTKEANHGDHGENANDRWKQVGWAALSVYGLRQRSMRNVNQSGKSL